MSAIGLFGLLMVWLSGQPQAAVPQAPKLTLAMTLRVQVGPPLELGEVPRGRRRIIPILGGTFEGPNIRGKVLPGGADWQIVRADGLAELDTRYALQTEQGSIIYIQNAGMRHAPPEVSRKSCSPAKRSIQRRSTSRPSRRSKLQHRSCSGSRGRSSSERGSAIRPKS